MTGVLARIVLVALAVLVAARAKAATAAERCTPVAGRVAAVEDRLEVGTISGPRFLAMGEAVCLGDQIRADRPAAIVLASGVTLRLDRGTELYLAETLAGERPLLRLLRGLAAFFSHRPHALAVDTPFANAAVEGTEFTVEVLPDRARVAVLEGRVRFGNPQGAVSLRPGEVAVAAAGRAPEIELRLRPRDAVRWALYYPPLGAARLPPGASAGLREAARLAAVGERAAALERLESVPAPARDAAAYHTLKAELLLGQGRAEEAAAAVAEALQRRPGDPDALALRSILALARDDKGQALADARRAVEQAPGDARARLALSYAAQATFDIPLARASLEAAVAAEPGNALAWARLGEAQLMQGDVRAAARSAARAVALDPKSARAQTVLGFVALARIDTRAAKAAFARAIELEAFAPLARLGLGLATIRDGDLAGGREQIELAVALDPDDALLRSYLGKAYLDEGRDEDAGEELATAELLDPNDPTPWFYDAVRKQLENRPVEALRDLERSIALNGNRAPFRSRLLLDEDAAARGASLGRIYDDLGFERLGRNEAAKALALDPANAAAHRFLADLYAGEERRRFARASEVLKAQLLAPPNANPLPARLAETRLRLPGWETLFPFGFNEYGSVFERDRVQAVVTGIAGTQSTYGEEVVAAGLSGPVALSASQLFTSTDGFRRNADARSRLQGVYGKAALNDSVSLQAEFRGWQSEEGDLVLDYDPEIYLSEFRWDRRQDTAHLGATVELAPNSTLLAAGFYSDRKEKQRFTSAGYEGALKHVAAEEGYLGELQHIWAGRGVDLVTGLSAYNADVHIEPTSYTFDGKFVEPPAEDFDSHDRTLYGYLGARPHDTVDLAVGLAIDHYHAGGIDFDELLPKFGVVWSPTPAIAVRAAALRTLKRVLVVEQTLEPTDVGGFTQFLDDLNGTVSELVGVGLDARLASGIYAGLEASYRNLSLPHGTLTHDASVEDHGEQRLRGYYYRALNDRMSLTGEISHDRFRGGKTKQSFLPKQADTTTLSLGWRYRDPSGVFADLTGQLVHQEVERARERVLQRGPEGSDSFLVLDAAVGYRLPRRRGLITLEVNNVLDQDFNYLDNSYRTANFRTKSPYLPERSILARVTLNF